MDEWMNSYRNKMVGTDMNKKTNGSLARFPFSFLKNYPIKKTPKLQKPIWQANLWDIFYINSG